MTGTTGGRSGAMTGAREEILRRIRLALLDEPAPPPIPRDYRGAGSVAVDLALFAERVADYHAGMHHAAPDGARAAIENVLRQRGIRRLAVPDGLPADWLPGGWLPDAELAGEPLTTAELDAVDGALTGCAVAVAETGTIVLDHGPGQGSRALSLVPDYHLVVVRADQVRATVPDVIAARSTRPGRRLGSAAPAPPATSSSTGSKACTARAPSTCYSPNELGDGQRHSGLLRRAVNHARRWASHRKWSEAGGRRGVPGPDRKMQRPLLVSRRRTLRWLATRRSQCRASSLFGGRPLSVDGDSGACLSAGTHRGDRLTAAPRPIAGVPPVAGFGQVRSSALSSVAVRRSNCSRQFLCRRGGCK